MTKFNKLRNEFLKNPNLLAKEKEAIKDLSLDVAVVVSISSIAFIAYLLWKKWK